MASKRTWCLYLLMWMCCGLACCEEDDAFNQNVAAETPKEVKSPDVEWTKSNVSVEERSEDFINYAVHVSYGCPVNHSLPCVPKCCNVSEGMTEGGCVVTFSDKFFPQFSDCPNDGSADLPVEHRYEYFIGDPCVDGKYALDKERYPADDYLLYSNGSLYYTKQILSMADYCMDVVNDSVRVFVCFESGSEPQVKFQHILYPVGLLLSLPFLLATAVTYTFIEKFRDLQGKCLTCHVLSMAVAYLCLAIVQLAGRDLSSNMCIATAFFIQFFFVASFCWLNVLSFYTYKNIHDMDRYSQLGMKNERRMFIMYSMYSWYMPGILLIVSMVMDLQPDIPDSVIKPQFGVRSCWFNCCSEATIYAQHHIISMVMVMDMQPDISDSIINSQLGFDHSGLTSDTAALPYFYGPVGFLILINVVFFGLSAYRIFKEKKQAVEDQNRGNVLGRVKKYMQLFKQCFLLFIIMGINWLMEIISWAVGGPDLIWLTTDIFNTLQGLLIFYIFVIRPLKVRRAVFKNLGRFWGKIRHCDIYYKEPPPIGVANFLPKGEEEEDDEEDENIRNDES